MEAMKKGMQITIKQSPWQHISLQNQKQTSKRNKAKKQHHLTTPGSTGKVSFRLPSSSLEK